MRVWQVRLVELGQWLCRYDAAKNSYWTYDRGSAVSLQRRSDAEALIAAKDIPSLLRPDEYALLEHLGRGAAWVIRAGKDTPSSPRNPVTAGQYWAGGKGQRWVDRPSDAIRFCRREDAEAAIYYSFGARQGLKATRKSVRMDS